MRASPYTAAFWTCADCSETMKGVRNAVSIFLSTGYCIGSVIAIILNLILPEDPDDVVPVGDNDEVHWSVIGQKSAYFKSKPEDDEDVEEKAKASDDKSFKEFESYVGDDKKDQTPDEEGGIIDDEQPAAAEQPKDAAEVAWTMSVGVPEE